MFAHLIAGLDPWLVTGLDARLGDAREAMGRVPGPTTASLDGRLSGAGSTATRLAVAGWHVEAVWLWLTLSVAISWGRYLRRRGAGALGGRTAFALLPTVRSHGSAESRRNTRCDEGIVGSGLDIGRWWNLWPLAGMVWVDRTGGFTSRGRGLSVVADVRHGAGMRY